MNSFGSWDEVSVEDETHRKRTGGEEGVMEGEGGREKKTRGGGITFRLHPLHYTKPGPVVH